MYVEILYQLSLVVGVIENDNFVCEMEVTDDR